MTLQRVEPGDNVSAGRQNSLVEQVNHLMRPATAGEAQYGTGGVTFHGPSQTLVALFELTGSVTYPNVTDAPSGSFDREPTPWAYARQIWCHQHQASDQTSDGKPVQSYFTLPSGPTATVWLPLAPRNQNGYAVGPPIAQSGTRVLCVFNRQSGRWEVVQGPPYFMACWGTLNAQLTPEGNASVRLYWGGVNSGMDVTAYDWLLAPATILPSGTRVKVEFFPQDNVWWVTGAQCS